MELSFNRGDIITIIDFIDDHWLQGELRGNRGYVPVAYVDPTPIASTPEATELPCSQPTLEASGPAPVAATPTVTSATTAAAPPSTISQTPVDTRPPLQPTNAPHSAASLALSEETSGAA